MTPERNPNRPTVPIRLKFRAGEALNDSLLEFVKPEVRDTLIKKNRPFYLFSQYVTNLGLYSGADAVEKDWQDVDKYELSVGTVAHNQINLLPTAEIDIHEDRFIQITVPLFFYTPRERLAMVRPPLFPPNFNGEVGVYTRIPWERAVGGIALNAAISRLRHNMGVNVPNAIMAPYKMFVTDASVFKKWDTAQIESNPYNREVA